MKEIDLKYKQIQLMRDLLIDELRPTFTSITVEHLKLVEMRLQTILMAGVTDTDIKGESKFFKQR